MPVRGRSRARLGSCALGAAFLALLGACSGGGGPAAGGNPNLGETQLAAVRYGRLVDVYGLRETTQGRVVDLVQEDVLIGPDIEDERPPNSTKTDDEILYDFIGTNPDNLQGRLLITRVIGSPAFQSAYADLERGVKLVTAGVFGQDTSLQPFTVVPRNAAFELEFTRDLGVDLSFFLEFDANGAVAGVKNTEAVQLLQIVGDPNDPNPIGDFVVIPSRVVPRGNRLIIDPVLLGSEGARYQVRNNASGMPGSPDQSGANIRIAVAVEGPLRIPGLGQVVNSPFSGTNNDGFRSIIRDFRSGNSSDNSADIARGFIRDSEPPRMVGEILMYLERVDPGDSGTQVVTVYKGRSVRTNGGVENPLDLLKIQEIDRGDVLRVIDPRNGEVLGATEVSVEPTDDDGDPAVQHVRCVVRALAGLEDIDPSNDPNYPADPRSAEGQAWLLANAPRLVLVTEFTYSRTHPISGSPYFPAGSRYDDPNVSGEPRYGDAPENFVTFSPTPLAQFSGEPSPPNENVSPFAEAIVRFTKPVDLATVKAFDTFFFATRDVVDRDLITAEFLTPRNIDPERFNWQKFITPHLVSARVIDEDGSQTAMRLQPTRGFYLDETMREADDPRPFEEKQFNYFLHVIGGDQGILDLAGNSIDFQSGNLATDFLTLEFALDTRKDQSNTPLYADNQVVSVVRRFKDVDEDEQPSSYIDNEVAKLDPGTGNPVPPASAAYPLNDVFGAVTYLTDGTLQARPTTRVTKVVDDLNQQPPPPQSSDLRFCPFVIGTENLVATATASVKFGQGIQNPLNPFGSRLQTVWREIDMSLSRTDPFDFNLDVEQMYWAPFTLGAITYDVFDRVSLFLGHSEFRPEPCVGAFSALPEMGNSGLKAVFADNFAHNLAPNTGEKTLDPAPHPAYVDAQMTIDVALAFTEPNGINRYLPLPEFQKPYFVWRDETNEVQGGVSGVGSDVRNASQNMPPYIISPWLGGIGRRVSGTPTSLRFNFNFWGNFQEFRLLNTTRADQFTEGGLGTIALPLLADFWTYCDDPDLPANNGFVATGFNGWQIALTVQSAPTPNFRAYSGGFAGSATRPSICVDQSSSAWTRAAGGYTPTGVRTSTALDNSLYWVMADFLKRQTVATFGFVDIFNPHRMPAPNAGNFDPRLGPYQTDPAGVPNPPVGIVPRFDYIFEPPIERGGTNVVAEFRAASRLDPQPWRYENLRTVMNWGADLKPDEINFPLDPLKAADAYIHKYDDRRIDPVGNTGPERLHWAFYYNREVTDYTTDIGNLSSDTFLNRFSGVNETLDVSDLRYFNWRFIMVNNVEATPPVSPTVDSFAVTYRFERQ
ncbi:MAG: hypothetical protein IPM29_11330 [Planctomycetes bacterium]|nr:hypothetical protein [Planctomycetota bacterium]